MDPLDSALIERLARLAPIKSVLFVCSANICRSYTAERLFKSRAPKAGLSDITAVSRAAWQGMDGRVPDPIVQDFLESEGADCLTPHYSRGIKPEELSWANLILCMEPWHIDEVLALAPDAADKTLLLGEFARGEVQPLVLDDPYGRPSPYYRAFFALLDKCIDGLIEALGKVS